MTERWEAEVRLVERVHGELEKAGDFSRLTFSTWPLGSGWSKTHTALMILIPKGYPHTPPDNFFVDRDLRLANGAMPASTNLESQTGREWLRFSYHVEASEWRPHADPESGHNLLTFLQGVTKRLAEAS